MQTVKRLYPLEPKLNEEDFNCLRELIKKEFGININGDKRLTIHTKLSHRLNILGFKSYREYYNYLINEPSKKELLNCVAHIVNNETYFMREQDRLELFRKLLVEIKQHKSKNKQYTLRVLSAGCSSGEEVYTLNILILESGLFTWGWDVRVIGMDVSKTAIKKAKTAIYTKNSFRTFNGNEKFIQKYFNIKGERYILKKIYQNNVQFIHGNLLSPDSFKSLDTMDVIFCRNVFIYMTDSAIRKVTENFFNILSDKGYLIIGSTESLLQKTDLFIPEYKEGVIVYRKNPHYS
jgi:chemotaxis protein methyltransferase CheR